jgi:hypothetical protein
MITINLEKAIKIWQNNIRINRVRMLEALDIMFLKAVEKNDILEQKKIADKKQKLRDATEDPRIYKVSSPEELKHIDPLSEIVL